MCEIRLEQVSKIYQTGDEKTAALDDVSFAVCRGEFLAVTGPSGCGKSTLLHVIGGLLAPTKGRVLIDGASLYEKNASQLARHRRRQAGIVYQFYNLVPELTALENLTLQARMDGKRVDEAWVDEVLGILGMQEKQNAYPHELSGGQQQKIALGRALVSRPWLLLADEPTGNLDCAKRDEVITLIKRLNQKEGMTVILVTHDPFVAGMAERRLRMLDGRLIEDTEGQRDSVGKGANQDAAGDRTKPETVTIGESGERNANKDGKRGI